MTVGEAIRARCETEEDEWLPILLPILWPELFYAELIPDFDEAPEERLRVAVIRPLTKNGDS